MANYCEGRWVKVLMEVVTPQTGRAEGSERHIIIGSALHCEGHVKGQLHFIYHGPRPEISTITEP